MVSWNGEILKMRNIDALVHAFQMYSQPVKPSSGTDKRVAHIAENVVTEEIDRLMDGIDDDRFNKTRFDYESSTSNRLVIRGLLYGTDDEGIANGYSSWKATLRPEIIYPGFSCDPMIFYGTLSDKDYISSCLREYFNTPVDGNDSQPETVLQKLCSLLAGKTKNRFLSVQTFPSADFQNICEQITNATGIGCLGDLSCKISPNVKYLEIKNTTGLFNFFIKSDFRIYPFMLKSVFDNSKIPEKLQETISENLVRMLDSPFAKTPKAEDSPSMPM